MPEPIVPSRVSHILTVSVLCDQLVPSYAKAHNCLEEEVYEDVKSGLVEARLQNDVCNAVWESLKKARPSFDEATLLTKLAKGMSKGGPRPMPASERAINNMAPLFAFIDVNVGRASDTARAALESPTGRAMLAKGLAAAGDFLSARLLSAAKA